MFVNRAKSVFCLVIDSSLVFKFALEVLKVFFLVDREFRVGYRLDLCFRRRVSFGVVCRRLNVSGQRLFRWFKH
jgi:hypothetical protein